MTALIAEPAGMGRTFAMPASIAIE
jgi:hypothetical protein